MAIDHKNNSPLSESSCVQYVRVASLDDAQDITGQVFFVWGGQVNVLRPWDAGELLSADERWDADELLVQLRDRFPDGAAPEGMMAGMQKAGGRSLRAL